MFPATLFDYNGVLVDDEHVHLEAFRDVLEPLGIEISEKRYWDELLGFDDAGAFRHVLGEAGLDADPARIKSLILAKRPRYMERARKSLKTFNGASELMRERARVGPVAVVSGALTDEIEFGLEKLGVRDLVGKIISAEDTSISKPDPEGYLMGVEWLKSQIGEGAARALVVEDSVDGITAAKRARLPTVAVAHSYSSDKLEESGADLVVVRLGDIDAEKITALYGKLFG